MTTRERKRKRRMHRTVARHLSREGGFFNHFSAIETTFWHVAQWHLKRARRL